MSLFNDDKCVFKNNDEWCDGKLKEISYEKPCDYWGWPKIYKCNKHKDLIADWKDALNTRSNVLTNNRKMTHTKEFVPYEGFEFWIGQYVEIEFCDVCKGVGGIKDMGVPLALRPCEKCNCTGRVE